MHLRESFAQNIDLHKSRIKPFEGFIFLCGGPTDVRSAEPVSIRDALYRELVKDESLERRIQVAEDFKDWSHDSTYSDLVLFERHLAELSSVIVLVVESPGAIAELGLFSIIKEFQDKLLVFMETDNYNADSFIRLGPIDYLEKSHRNYANCQRWTRKINGKLVFDPTKAIELQQELAESVKARVEHPTKERIFDSTQWIDCALLLCDFLNLHSALTLREIRELFAAFGIQKTDTEVKQKLFLLERVGLLKMEPKGEQRFYVGLISSRHFHLHLRDQRLDLDRYRSDTLEIYAKEDIRRFRAIQQVRQRDV